MNDSNIVTKAKQGDHAAMVKLYNQNFDSLYKFIWHKVMNEEIAKDLCAEAFVRAFEGIAKFEGKSSFKTWVYGIANNLILDWIKHKSKSSEWNHGDEEVAEEERREDEDGTVSLLVHSILNELKENYRKILELRYLMNYSIKEAAEVLDISVSNAKVLQMRALRKAEQIYITKLSVKN